MKAFWFGSTRGGNWGDVFNVPLISRLTGAAPTRHDGPGKLLAVGSVLHKLAAGDTVWGSGMLAPSEVPLPLPSGVRWCAVRGPMTRRVLCDHGATVPQVYGDPALLVPWLYRPEVPVIHRLGVIPHYRDLPALRHLASPEVLVIDIRSGIEAVIRAVGSCESIASSSLHGVVLGDAYRKPTAWLRVDGGARLVGRGWKFEDYLAGTNRKATPTDLAAGAPLPALRWLPPPKIDLEKLLAACPCNPLGLRLVHLTPEVLR